MYVTWKLDRYEFDRDAGKPSSTVTETLDNYYSPVVRQSIGSGRDTFDIKFTNFDSTLDTKFNIGDRLNIYRKVNSSSIESSDILLSGTVTDVPFTENESSNILSLKGNNYTETLMQALSFVGDKGAPIDSFIQQAINSVNLSNKNFKIIWSSTNPSSPVGSSTSFPGVNETWYYKSLLKLLEKYSQKDFTGDGYNYYYYVDTQNRLIWQPRLRDTVASFNSATDDYKALRTKKDKKGVVNFVVAKGGRTPSNRPTTLYQQNTPSMAKNGFKFWLDLTNATWIDDRADEDRNSNLAAFPEGNTHPSTYPFTTSWTSLITQAADAGSNVPAMTKGSTIQCANADEYDQALFLNCRAKLKENALAILDERANGKLQLEITFSPEQVNLGLGDGISVTEPIIGKQNQPMRVADIEYTTTTTKVVLEEDIGSA